MPPGLFPLCRKTVFALASNLQLLGPNTQDCLRFPVSKKGERGWGLHSGSLALAPTQSNKAEEQTQQQQPGKQQAQQPLPPATAGATGAPGRCSPPCSSATGATATTTAMGGTSTAAFASTTTSTSVIAVVFCGKNREDELNLGCSCLSPFKIGDVRSVSSGGFEFV